MPSPPVKFGLTGFGAWGQMHAQAITRHSEAALTAITAPSETSRSLAQKLYPEAKIYPDQETMLRDCGVDVVDIVTPSHTHLALASNALGAGKHVLLEKPMALNVKDCRALVALAEHQKVVLAVGHELRLSSQWGKIKEIIQRGEIGVPQYVLVELSRKPYRTGADGWRYDAARVGSWVLEEPIHFFDLARWYLSGEGNPSSLYAVANARDPARPALHDNFSAILRCPSGAYAVVSQTLAAFEHHQTVKVAGTKGALWAAWSGALDRTLEPTCSLRVFDGETLAEVPLARQSGEVFELREEIAMMVRCVRGEDTPIASGQDGLWSAALCLAAEEAIQRGSPVDLATFLEGTAQKPSS